jgi:acetyltransferase-like isoleucine patch superfamily enzyme
MAPPTLQHDWYPRPLPQNVVIGPRSWCYSAFAFLHCRSRRPCGVRIGADTGIYNGTFFELGDAGEVEIGDYCTLVGAMIRTDSRVSIGDYTFIAHEVVIADDAFATPADDGRTRLPPSRETGWRTGSAGASRSPFDGITIGPNVWIAARAVILGGADIGEGAIVGAAAVVDFPVPPYAIVAGNPAMIVGWASSARGPVPPTGPQGR